MSAGGGWRRLADLTYLQDQDGTAATAPLRVVPGSHRDYTDIPAAETGLAHPRELRVAAPVGSVVFTHCGLLHTGTPNRTAATRCAAAPPPLPHPSSALGSFPPLLFRLLPCNCNQKGAY